MGEKYSEFCKDLINKLLPGTIYKSNKIKWQRNFVFMNELLGRNTVNSLCESITFISLTIMAWLLRNHIYIFMFKYSMCFQIWPLGCIWGEVRRSVALTAGMECDALWLPIHTLQLSSQFIYSIKCTGHLVETCQI